jgi:hypothetical protein
VFACFDFDDWFNMCLRVFKQEIFMTGLRVFMQEDFDDWFKIDVFACFGSMTGLRCVCMFWFDDWFNVIACVGLSEALFSSM